MSNLFNELKRRNVFRVGAAYTVVGWVLLQVVGTVAPGLGWPDWVMSFFIVFIGVGFPIALIFSWAYEMTPEGVKKTHEVDADESITHSTGEKLNRMIVGGLVVALAYFVWESRFANEDVADPANVVSVEHEPVVIAAPAEERITIAVLPFADLSAAGDQEYFGDGIAEEIINRLVSLDALKVTSRTSAFSFKNRNISIPEIAAELGARYVLEGSVRTAGNRLRITAQLIEVASDTHLWSETYDRQMDDIFAVQDDISASIATTLEVRLVGNTGAKVPTDNFEAYRLYLQGHHLFLQRGIGNLVNAVDRFEGALALDPEFAEAWADLAAATILLPAYSNKFDLRTAIEDAMRAAERALSIDADLAEAFAAKGYIHIMDFEWAEAHASFLRAVDLNPESDTAWLWLGLSRAYVGYLADAQELVARAVDIAPQSGINYGQLGRIRMMRGDAEGALKEIEQGSALGWRPGLAARAAYWVANGNSDEAAADYKAGFEALEEVWHDQFGLYLEAYSDPSKREEARALLSQNLEAGRPMQALFGSLLIGDGEGFVYALEYPYHNPVWIISEIWHPLYRPVLNDPAVKDYFTRIGLVDYWHDEGWPDYCRPVGADDYVCE